jgi:hypothetical protein
VSTNLRFVMRLADPEFIKELDELCRHCTEKTSRSKMVRNLVHGAYAAHPAIRAARGQEEEDARKEAMIATSRSLSEKNTALIARRL